MHDQESSVPQRLYEDDDLSSSKFRFGSEFSGARLSLQINDDDESSVPSQHPRNKMSSIHRRTTSMNSDSDLQALLSEDTDRVATLEKKLAKKANRCLKTVNKTQAEVTSIIKSLR